jgi:hypothetical protein
MHGTEGTLRYTANGVTDWTNVCHTTQVDVISAGMHYPANAGRLRGSTIDVWVKAAYAEPQIVRRYKFRAKFVHIYGGNLNAIF